MKDWEKIADNWEKKVSSYEESVVAIEKAIDRMKKKKEQLQLLEIDAQKIEEQAAEYAKVYANMQSLHKVIQSILPQIQERQVPDVDAIKSLLQTSKTTDEVKLAGRFQKLANGVVRDNSTTLEWIVGRDEDTDWNEAKKWVDSLNNEGFAGGDWRLPELDELRGLYEEGKTEWNIDPIFGSSRCYRIWSNQEKNSSSVFAFNFDGGLDLWPVRSASFNLRVFGVRGG